MSFESIIAHMNDHHKGNLIDLCEKFANKSGVKDATLVGVDFDGLDIEFDGGQKVRVPFNKKADENTIKDIIIELCMSAKKAPDTSKIKAEVAEFKKGFGSVVLATIDAKGEAQATYAPLVQTENGDYIYISEVASHYKDIKERPDNIEVLFVEDESKAASMILRKRLRYRVSAGFIERGADFDKIYDEFERQNKGDKGIEMIRQMTDFHLVKLSYGEGSFVKGFGQAYRLDKNGEIIHMKGGASGNPHRHGAHAHGASGHGHPHG